MGHKSIASLEEIPRLLELAGSRTSQVRRYGRCREIAGCVGAFRELLDVTSPEALTRLIEACKQLREKEATEAKVFYESVLEDGIKWIKEEGRTACPLCESPIEPAATIAGAQSRLDSMRELITLRNQASSRLTQAIASVRAMMESAARAVKSLSAVELPTQKVSPLSIDEFLAIIATLEQELHEGFGELDLGIFGRLVDALRPDSPEKSSISNIVGILQRAFETLPSPDRAKLLLSARQRIRTAVEGWDQLESRRSLL